MVGGCSASPPSSGDPKTGSSGGASTFLANLPSRGLFSSTVLSSNPGGMRVYICDHDTTPPEDQLIKTNQTNILIRSLMLKNKKIDTNGKGGVANSRKRAAEKALDGKAAGKKAMSSHEGSSSELPRDLQSLTNEKLRVILRERGLSVKGRKEELIVRLRG